MEGITKFLKKLESQSLKNTFLIIFAWIFVRVFFEGIFEAAHTIGYLPFSYKAIVLYFIHYPSFYLSLFLLLVIITSLVNGLKIDDVTKTFSFGFGIIILVPLIDWIIGGGYAITYPLRIGPYLINSLNPFVSITEYGGSPGQRIIFFLICLMISLYLFFKKRRILLSILTFFITYFTIIIFGGLPTIIAADRPEDIYITGGILYSDTQKFAAIFLLLLVITSMLYYYLIDKKKFKLILSSLRPERALFYGGLGLFGLLLSLHQAGVTVKGQFPFLFDKLGIVIIWLSLAFGFQGAASINDFFDRDGDELTRHHNPLIKGLAPDYYLLWTIVITCLSFILALTISFVSFLIMFTLIAISILYSVPPVRLKRIPIISSFVLAVAAVLAMGIGYSIITGTKALNKIPHSILVPTIIGITLGFIAKDIQDIPGDKKAGVITIPALLTRQNGGELIRLPIGLIIGSSYLVYALFIPRLFVGAIIFSTTTLLYTVFAKELKEWFYFLMLYLFGAYLIFMLSYLPVLK